MSLIDDIGTLGADIEDAMERFMGKTELYERMLKKLPGVLKDTPVMEYIESEDYDTALSNAHSIKGIVGNLSLAPLHNGYTTIVECFREDRFEQAKSTLVEILKIQQDFVDCINKYTSKD